MGSLLVMWNPVLNPDNKKPVESKFKAPHAFSLLLLTCLFVNSGISYSDENNSNTKANAARTNVASKKVKTIAYKDVAIKVSHTLGGVVPAAQNSHISAQISAIINNFHVDTGHEVQKGDLLVSLDCRENKLRHKQSIANLKAEQAQLQLAIKQFDQAEKLSSQGNIAKETYNQREAEVSRLRATVENKKAAKSISQINIDRCQIKAPYAGYITNREASIGELTQPGTYLLKLVSKTNNIVEVKINNRLLTSFSQGENHQFTFNNQSYPLKVKFVLPVLDTTTRNHIARLNFVEQPAITGSVGKVQWHDKQSSIPSSYLIFRNDKLGVFIAEENKAKFIEIVGAREGQPAIADLESDTQIITKGRFNIRADDLLLIDN